MSRRVFLHVGLPKSGTTYLQAMLKENKQRLMDSANLLFPGSKWYDQVVAVRDVRGMQVPLSRRAETEGGWQRLVEEMASWDGNSVMSMEWLCAAKPEQVRRIVDDLHPARVEVVFTVRDLGRTLPAAWQEFMQNRGEWSWGEFLEGVAADDSRSTPAGGRFWSQQDIVKLMGNWAEVVPAAQIHVVTLPHPGAAPDVLWLRMCQVLGIDGSGYSVESADSNVSLGLESAELMRRLNPLAREAGMRKSLYHQVFKHGLAKRVLARRSSDQSRLSLPEEYRTWALDKAAQQVQAIEAAQVNVVGDLQDLQPVLTSTHTLQPEDVPDDVLLEATLAGLVIMGRQWDRARNQAAELAQENQRLQERLKRSQRRAEGLQERIAQVESHPVRTAVGAGVRRVRRRKS